MELYEISQNYRDFLIAYENEEIPQEAFKDTLDAIDGEFTEKIDCISCYIKELLAEEREIKREIEALTKRKIFKQNAVEKLKEYVKNHMLSVNKLKVETPRNKIQIRKNPPSINFGSEFLDWAQKNAVHFLKFSEPVPDKTKIKESLKKGEKIPFVTLFQAERIDIK
jgi:hypothetical protein